MFPKNRLQVTFLQDVIDKAQNLFAEFALRTILGSGLVESSAVSSELKRNGECVETFLSLQMPSWYLTSFSLLSHHVNMYVI